MNSKELLALYEQYDIDLKDRGRDDWKLQKAAVMANLQIAIQIAMFREHIETRRLGSWT